MTIFSVFKYLIQFWGFSLFLIEYHSPTSNVFTYILFHVQFVKKTSRGLQSIKNFGNWRLGHFKDKKRKKKKGRGGNKENPGLAKTFSVQDLPKVAQGYFLQSKWFLPSIEQAALLSEENKQQQKPPDPEQQPLGIRKLPANPEALLGCLERRWDTIALCVQSLTEVCLETNFFQVDIAQSMTQFWNQNIFSCDRKLFYLDKALLQEIIKPSLSHALGGTRQSNTASEC